MSRFMDSWISGFLDFQILDSWISRFSNSVFLDFQIFKFCIPGFPDSWMSRFPDCQPGGGRPLRIFPLVITILLGDRLENTKVRVGHPTFGQRSGAVLVKRRENEQLKNIMIISLNSGLPKPQKVRGATPVNPLLQQQQKTRILQPQLQLHLLLHLPGSRRTRRLGKVLVRHLLGRPAQPVRAPPRG